MLSQFPTPKAIPKRRGQAWMPNAAITAEKGAPSCSGVAAKAAWPGDQSTQDKSAQGRHALRPSYPGAN